MATFDPEKVRQALRDAKREITDAERRLAARSSLIGIDALRARRAVREAQSALREMIALLNANPGRGINFGLVERIWATEKRLNRAREVLSRINPPVNEHPKAR
jgi:phage shock protein A